MEFEKLNGIDIEDDDDDQINNEIDINQINVNMVSNNSLKGSKVSYSNKLEVISKKHETKLIVSVKNDDAAETQSKGYTESAQMTPLKTSDEKSKKSPSKTQMEFSNTKKLMIKETPVMLQKFESKKASPPSAGFSGNLYDQPVNRN